MTRMIKASHKYWAEKAFDFYESNLLRRNFSNFFLVNDSPGYSEFKSLVLTPNHMSWWDGFFVHYLNNKVLKKKFHIMMLEEQLKRYWFFRKVGAFSIDPANSKKIIQTSNYTKSLLGSANNLVVIYPQGRIQSFDKKIIDIKTGLKIFLNDKENMSGVIPVAFKIHYYEDKNPAVLVRFGEVTNSQTLIQNFDLFQTRFLLNIDLLNKASLEKEFLSDLFNKKD